MNAVRLPKLLAINRLDHGKLIAQLQYQIIRYTQRMVDTKVRSQWLATPRLIIVGAILCLLGVAIAAYPSYLFMKHMWVDIVFPIQKFDANTETVLELPDSDTRYVIAVAVNERRGQAPPVEFVLSADVGEVESNESRGSINIMGHYYQSLHIVSLTGSQKITVTAQADPSEDFIVYRFSRDTINRRLSETIPWWIAGGIPFFAGLGVVFFVIFRLAFQKDEIKLELNHTR